VILHIARHRFLSNLITLRFSASFVLCILLFAASAFILSGEYRERLEEYDAARGEMEKRIQEITVFSRLSVGVFRSPSPLSVLCEGADKRLGTGFNVGFDSAPSIAEAQTVRNPLLAVFPSFDGTAVVEVVLSLLAVFLAYNSISGQREEGTLKLILSGTIPRHVVLAGEFIGGMASAVLPLLTGFAVSLVIIVASPSIRLDGKDFLIAGLLAALAALYLSVFFTLGLLLSSRIRRSVTVLILMLVTWVITVIVWPQAANYTARRIVPVTDKSEIDRQAQELRYKWVEEMNRYAREHPWPMRPILANLAGEFPDAERILHGVERQRQVYTGSWPYAFSYYFGPRELVEWYLDGSIYGHRLRMEYEDRIWQVHRDYLGRLEKQAGFARILSLLSPSSSYYRAAAHLTGTSEGAYLSFIEATSRYRRELIAYMKDKEGLDSYLLFTRKPAREFPSARDILEMNRLRGPEAVRTLAEYPIEPLPLDDLPGFAFEARDLSRGIAAALPEISMLAVYSGLFLLLSWVLFLRADVR
jgi:ABC-type transport system involved in multi-copper enzyme maturation permease subunit